MTGSVDGYLTISPIRDTGCLVMENKFDYLSSGRAKTGYHKLRDASIANNSKGLQVVSVGYIEVLEAFKVTQNAEEFLAKLQLL